MSQRMVLYVLGFKWLLFGFEGVNRFKAKGFGFKASWGGDSDELDISSNNLNGEISWTPQNLNIFKMVGVQDVGKRPRERRPPLPQIMT
ncbi:unnamed protein product [Amaranthus hypochondriacus]